MDGLLWPKSLKDNYIHWVGNYGERKKGASATHLIKQDLIYPNSFAITTVNKAIKKNENKYALLYIYTINMFPSKQLL